MRPLDYNRSAFGLGRVDDGWLDRVGMVSVESSLRVALAA